MPMNSAESLTTNSMMNIQKRSIIRAYVCYGNKMMGVSTKVRPSMEWQ